jgi:uncharacterized protein YciI
MQFQLLTIVRLLTAVTPRQEGPHDAAIQAGHLAHLVGLRDRGIVLLNGPARDSDDPRFRGMTIYSVPMDEARAHALADPAVRAGWFEVEATTWWLPTSPTMIGDRVDLELPPSGE